MEKKNTAESPREQWEEQTQMEVKWATQGFGEENRRRKEGLAEEQRIFLLFFFFKTLKNTRELTVSTEGEAGKGCLEAN